MANPQRGFVTPLLLVMIVVLIIGGGAYVYVHTKQQDQFAESVTFSNTEQPVAADAGIPPAPMQAVPVQTTTTTASAWLPVSALPSSYEINGWTWYWVANGEVHCMNYLVPNVDITTFLAASTSEYAKDSQHVYRCSDIVKDADPSSFTILNKNFAKDRDHVYYAGSIVNGADAVSFESVPSPALSPDGSRPPYGKDKNHVYFLSEEIKGADPQTFTTSPVIRDKDWIYQNGRIFGPVSLISEAYAHALPANCTKEGFYKHIEPSLVPSIFSKDGTVVGYVGPDAACIIDKKSQKSEFYEKGWEAVVALSDDGSKLYYSRFQKEGAAYAGESCADCGMYAIDRATGEEVRVK